MSSSEVLSSAQMPGIGRNLTEAQSVLLEQTSEVSTLQQPYMLKLPGLSFA
jgi:hypothetical protein